MTMQEIEKLTRRYADAREALLSVMGGLQEEIDAAKRRRLAKIRALVERMKARQEELAEALEQSRAAFQKPRTRVIHGVKIGLQKRPGRLEIVNEQRTIQRIRDEYPEEEGVLIRVTESVNKKALQDLQVGDLKKLGVHVEDAADKVVIRGAESDVDKLVAALLDEDLEASADGAAAA